MFNQVHVFLGFPEGDVEKVQTLSFMSGHGFKPKTPNKAGNISSNFRIHSVFTDPTLYFFYKADLPFIHLENL
jgi:hypothetical protein